MRWALLADVHGNLEALCAVLRDLDDWPDHRLVCAGDIVGYGPDPEACVQLLAERNAVCVFGNHEAMVLGRIDFQRCVHSGIRAAVWTRGQLSRSGLQWLARLPQVARPAPELVVCHATLDDFQSYVTSEGHARPVLAAVATQFPGAAVITTGHTHFAAFHRSGRAFRHARAGTAEEVLAGELHLVNPGSVGQARDGKLLARYARYDSERGTVSYRGLAYDPAPTLKKLRTAGLVAKVCYAPQVGWLEGKVQRARTQWARDRTEQLPAFE